MKLFFLCVVVFCCTYTVTSDTSSDDGTYRGCGNMQLQSEFLKMKEELSNRFQVISELTAIHQLYRTLSVELDKLKTENKILKEEVKTVQNDTLFSKTKIDQNTDSYSLYNYTIVGLKEDREKFKQEIATELAKQSNLLNAAIENITLLQTKLSESERLRIIQGNLIQQMSSNFSPQINQFTLYKETSRNKENVINSTLKHLSADVELLKSTISQSVTKPKECNPAGCKVYQSSCKQLPGNQTGIYTIEPVQGRPVNVTCMAGGWTVIQQRKDGSVDFYRTWQEYKNGFGTASSEYWIGNNAIHTLTSSGKCELRIEMVDINGNDIFANYQKFSIEDEAHKYVLHLSGYSGNKGNKLDSNHNGQKFTTKDQDNDTYGRNCGILKQAGYWYRGCNASNLNGKYHEKKCCKGFYWGSGDILQKSTMMVRCN